MKRNNKTESEMTFSRADGILFGKLKGRQEALLENKDNRFAYAFMLLAEHVTGKTEPVDEAHLAVCENPLEYLSQTQNVHADYFTLEYGWWKHDVGSFLGFFGTEQTPVLVLRDLRGYRLFNPQTQASQRVVRTCAEEFGDRAVYLLPREGERAESVWKLFRYAMRKQRRECLIYLVLMFFGAAVSLAVPMCIRSITNNLIPNNELTGILVVMISMILGVLAGFLVNIAVNRTRIRMQTHIGHTVMSAVFGRIMNFSSEEEKKLADLITGLILPFIQAVETLVDSGLGVALYLLQCLVVLNVIALCDPGNSRFIFILIGLEMLAALLLQSVIFKNTLRGREAETRLTSARREMLDNMEAIRSGAIEERIYYRFAVAYDDSMRVKLRIQNMNQWITLIGTMVSGIGVLVIFARVSLTKNADLGAVSAMVASFSLLASYLNCLVLAGAEIAGSIPHLRFADTILTTPTEDREIAGVEREISGAIELSDVTFAYGIDANPVIRNLNLTVRPGEYIGIVGTSGCGKSTLLRLMLGFLSPTEGSVSYDGIELNQYNLKLLRRQFGVVLQDAAVVTGSIRRNIGLSDTADMEQVAEAAKSAAIYDEIEAMPMKFETHLSSEAEMISGGQRQRIVLARALMHKPKILFLDEATSAMDNVSQKVVKENMDALGITRISVAHRLSTVIDCDRILVMDQGEIVEQGSFQELMELDGLFARMAKRNLT
ncbi:MAG: ATP-binding cassette domain-containing protein [Oscillospiraceae bacterium]|nr:ATP-binding cassette domain-containing protein [Oscillospiraceae bacterium]